MPAGAAASVSAVGSLAFKAGTDTTTLAVSPQHVGDLLVLFAKADASGVTVSSISGGGVGTWTRSVTYSGYATHDLELWTGDVSTTGASTITVKFSASVTSIYTGLASQEFSSSSGAGTTWSVDTTGGISNAASTAVTFPKLTPSGTGELYFSYAAVAGTAASGKTAGFTYATTSDGDVVAYDVSVSSAQQPTTTQSPSGVSGAVAVLVAAQATGGSPTLPTVTAVGPSSGPTAGGTTVTVTGTNLTGATAVKFGSTAATSFSVVSATSISAVAPAGSGTVNVTVTTPSGTSATSTLDQYIYTSTTPTVTAVGPSSGPTAGGTTVTVTGTNLTGATAVNFGSTAATSFSVVSATSISAVVPAEPAWTTDITVTTSAGTSASTSSDHFTFSAAAPTVATVPHVMEIMMENEAYSDLIGNSAAPNINKLTQTYALTTQSYAIGHPSLPNYLEMIAGSNYGVTNDDAPSVQNISSGAQTLVNQLETAGISWRAYFESMPSAGYTGTDTGGTDPYGGEYYLQHHNPFVYFPAVTSLADFDQNVVPLTSVTGVQSDLNASSAPDYVWVTPNAVDDMHDGPAMSDTSSVPTVGDAWLANFIAHVQSTSWYGAGGQIIVQWDEGLDSDTSGVGTAGEGGGGHILTLVISANLAANPSQYSTPFNTAGILHSVEATYGLPFLADAANAGNGNINSLLGLGTAPTVTSVSPSSGPIAGGTSVTVTGTNLTGAIAVNFGSLAATSFSVTSSTTLTAVSPAVSGAAAVDVTVTTPAGGSATNATDKFTYASASPQFTADSATASAAVGSLYSYTYVATGTPAPTFSVSSGSLPPGVTLNSSSGVLSGTPTTTTGSPFLFVVSASNSVSTVVGTQQSIAVTNAIVIQRAATFPVSSESAMNSSITVDPQKVGDLMILSDQLHSTSIDVTAVSGGNSGTWQLAEQFVDTANSLTYQVWYAVATSTGSSTITLTYSAATTLAVELIADSFTSSRPTTWSVAAGGGVSNSSSTTVLFPSLTSGAAPGELYWGASEEHETGVAGTTPGFTYGVTSVANVYLYNASLSPTTAYAPSAGQTPAGVATSVGVIFSAQ
jgi:hypothetical protein